MIPNINIWSVDPTNIFLNWQIVTPDVIQSYNLYGSPAYNGTYTLLQTMIPNGPPARTSFAYSMAPGSVLVKIVRSLYTIAVDQPYFFKITSIINGVESAVSDSNFVSVDPLDVYKERRADDFNPVYKNIAVLVLNGTTEQFVDIERILDRQANFVQIRSDQPIVVRWNSSWNDPIDIPATSAAIPYVQFDRRAITIKSAYIDNTSGSDATVSIFVSGN